LKLIVTILTTFAKAMMRKLYIPLLFLFASLFFGCHKDNPVPLQPYPKNCSANGFDTMPSRKGGGAEPMIYFDTPYVEFPYFNPSNADELIYYRADNKELIKYNIVSKSKQILYKGLLFNVAKWSRKGWILLPTGEGQIWKIKDDGTQLTQLTFGAIRHYIPEWNMEGTKFICESMNIGHGYSTIYDEYGNPLDSIKNTGLFCWQQKDQILSRKDDNGIGIVDIKTDSFIVLYSFPSNTTTLVFGCYWMADGINAVLSTSMGVFSFNTQSKRMIFLRQTCENDLHISVCVSFISNKMLFERDSWHYVGNGTILIKNKLVLMNTDGSGEVEIEL